MKICKPFSNNWQNSILSVLFSVVFLIALISPMRIAKGCGPILEFRGYTFIQPEIINMQAAFAPFIMQMSEVYDFFEQQEKITDDANIDEWHTRFCEVAPKEHIRNIVYESNFRDLDQLLTAIVSPSVQLPARLNANRFARHLYRYGCRETVEYLMYAISCEPYVQALNLWQEEERDVPIMNDLIESGMEAFNEVESHYVKLRYAFQIIRLAHYSNQFSRVLELYDELMPRIDNDPSIIEDWIIALRAGALKHLEEPIESAYLFSRIFDQCPSRRTQAFNSFELTSEEEWRACMKLCQTDHERATLYVLRANSSHANIVEEMKQIYKLDPQNENLSLLLIRELRQLEKDLLGIEFNNNKNYNKNYFDRPRPFAGDLVLDLFDFVRQIIADQTIADLDIWHVAEGYLQFLAGNYYYAARTFDRIEPMIKNELLRKQLATFQAGLQIASYEAVNDSIERATEALMRSDIFKTSPTFADFIGDKFSTLYQQTGHPGKAFIIQYPLDDLKPNPKLSIIDDLIDLARNERKNRFERMMIGTSRDTTVEYDLLDMKASYYLSNFQTEAALEVYKEIPENHWDDYGVYNPFHESIKDCVFDYCRVPDSLIKMNKGQLLQRLIAMEYRAKADPENAAALFFQLGNAFYNMTYFSYAWNVMDYFRSGSSLPAYGNSKGEDVRPSYGYPYGNRENFDCSHARSFYERARILAKDPELAAKAAFMAAKCERNQFYAYGGERTYENFNLLVTSYRNTDFYQSAIAECKYFEAYVNR